MGPWQAEAKKSRLPSFEIESADDVHRIRPRKHYMGCTMAPACRLAMLAHIHISAQDCLGYKDYTSDWSEKRVTT